MAFEKGGYIPSPNDGLSLAMEATGTSLAVAAIALGLDERQAELFFTQAYPMLRGRTTKQKYEAMIMLAYKIKQEI